jgi:hypothetical protein
MLLLIRWCEVLEVACLPSKWAHFLMSLLFYFNVGSLAFCLKRKKEEKRRKKKKKKIDDIWMI